MMRSQLLRKYFLLATIIVILFLCLGFFASIFITRSLEQTKLNNDFSKKMLPPIFIAKVIDNLKIDNKVKALEEMQKWQSDEFALTLTLINENVEVLYSKSKENLNLPTKEQLAKLKNDYDYIYLDSASFFDKARFPMMPPPQSGFKPGNRPLPPPDMNNQQIPPPPDMGGPGVGPDGLGGLPPMPPPDFGFEHRDAVIKMKGEPNYFLIIGPPKMPEMKFDQNSNRKYFPIIGIASLFLSLLIGIGVTLFVIYISVYKKLNEADDVINQIKTGNLKARFKILRQDEFGEAMLRFNKMADEIENLVEHLKFVELARTKLLQELAHDLRTPIASLKTLLETLESKDGQLSTTVRKELLELSSREIEYFEKLVEDLLLLSQVSEPKYSTDNTEIDVQELLEEEVDDQIVRNRESEVPIEFVRNLDEQRILLIGNSLLFRRMLKNILNNATSFAHSKINIQVKKNNDSSFEMIFDDDGSGFSDEQVKNFGIRKISRQYIIDKESQSKRLSIGLGSVVIKKICQLHRGDVFAENRIDEKGQILGARIRIVFHT